MTRTRPAGLAAVLVSSGAVLSVCVICWSLQGDQTSRVAGHLLLYGAAFTAYLAALAASQGISRRGLHAALGLALVWRLVLVPVSPLLSDDVNRYVWEGRIQLHGGNPYRWMDRPEVEKWAPLRDGVWEGVSHKFYTAIYPPGWQLAARGVVAVHDSVLAMRAFLTVCEVATLGLLAAVLRRRGLPAERLLVLAWSPLALVEIAGTGHNESFGFLFMVAAVLALDAGRPFLSALAMTLAFQAKLVPGLVALAWVRRYRAWHIAGGGLLAALLVVPYLGERAGLYRSLEKYGAFWLFNETAFDGLAALLGSHSSAVLASSFLVAAVGALLAWRRTEPVAAALAVLTAWLLLTPNVLPWYALWLLPLLVVRDAPPLLLFTGTVQLAYLVYPAWSSGEPWQVGWGIRALEYSPCVVVGLLWWARARRTGTVMAVPRSG